MATNNSPFRTLPRKALQRVLLGVPFDDHDATAAACRNFRDVIRDPRFQYLRQENGFAEQIPPPYVGPGRDSNMANAFAHNGRIVVVHKSGVAFHRGTGSDMIWSPLDLNLGISGSPFAGYAGGSVLLG